MIVMLCRWLSARDLIVSEKFLLRVEVDNFRFPFWDAYPFMWEHEL